MDVEAALAAWRESVTEWEADQGDEGHELRTAGGALAELVARIPALEADLENATEHAALVNAKLDGALIRARDLAFVVNGGEHDAHAAEGLGKDGCARCIIAALRAEVSSLTAQRDDAMQRGAKAFAERDRLREALSLIAGSDYRTQSRLMFMIARDALVGSPPSTEPNTEVQR